MNGRHGGFYFYFTLTEQRQDFGGGYDHSYRAGSHTVLRGGAVISRYDSQTGEYTHTGYGAWLGVVQELPLELILDVRARYTHRDYDHPSSFDSGSSSDRRDHVVYVDAALERPITDHLPYPGSGI